MVAGVFGEGSGVDGKFVGFVDGGVRFILFPEAECHKMRIL